MTTDTTAERTATSADVLKGTIVVLEALHAAQRDKPTGHNHFLVAATSVREQLRALPAPPVAASGVVERAMELADSYAFKYGRVRDSLDWGCREVTAVNEAKRDAAREALRVYLSQGHGAPTGQSSTFEAGEATCASNEPDEQKEAEHRCPTCNGNDADAPCAYPGEGMPGCPRDVRLTSSVSQGLAQDAARYRWLRDSGVSTLRGPWPVVGSAWNDTVPCIGPELDAAIDAALPLPQPTGERE